MFRLRTTRNALAPLNSWGEQATPGRDALAMVPPAYGIDFVDRQDSVARQAARGSSGNPAVHTKCPTCSEGNSVGSCCGAKNEMTKNPGGSRNHLTERRKSDGEEDRKNTAATAGPMIDITFDPSTSKLASKCKQIVHTQFIRTYADSKSLKPGDYYSGLSYQDAKTTSKNWVVDYVSGETTPDYQQGSGVGKKNGGSTSATMDDTPGTGGGDKGFKSPGNPGGWSNVVFSFATYAWCMKGSDCGKWYEGMTWKWEKSAADQIAGRDGTASVVNSDAPGPLAHHLDAFKKFGYKPCK